MVCFPSLFISHGAPTLAIEDGAAHRYLGHLGRALGKPDAILVVSAHYDERCPAVSTTDRPVTIHDFGGFPRKLYEIEYPAPGAPALAAAVIERLRAKGLDAVGDDTRGLDHGAWVPLSLMYPDAEVPVAQLSISLDASPEWHHELGLELADLRRDGVLLVGSGSATHNLQEYFSVGYGHDDPSPSWVSEFANWLADRVEAKDTRSVLSAATEHPLGRRNHPTMDHIHPLFFALGAGGTHAQGRRLHQSTTYGVLAMDVYGFGELDDLTGFTDPQL